MPTYKNRAKPVPMKPSRWWGAFNFGRLMSIHYRRKDAWKCIDDMNPNDTGWQEFRRYFTVEPVIVTKAPRASDGGEGK